MMPSDADLPFLIVHGAIVWKVLLVVLPVIAFGAMLLWRRRKHPDAPRIAPARAAVFLAIAAALSYGMLRFVGGRASAALKDRSFGNHGRFVELSNLDAYSIAAAMPGSRANALEQLEYDLENHDYRDTATVRRLLAMNQRRHGCGGVYWWLHRAQRYEDALATAQRCKLDDGGVDALVQLGRFDDALAVMPADAAPRVAGRVAIAAGRWDLAAVHADAAAEAATHPDDYGDDPQRRHRAHLRYRCLAALFRSRSGDADAGARIAADAAAPGGEACALVGAQLLPAPERAAALETAANRLVDADDHELQSLGYLATVLAWADGIVAEHRFDSFYDPARGLLDVHSVKEEWLAPWAAPALIAAGAPLRAQAAALGWTAVVLVLRGDLDGARSIASRLPAMLAAEEHAAVDARAFAAVLELRGDRVDLPFIRMPGAEDEVELRRGKDRLDDIGFYSESCKDDYRAAIRAAQDGDGAPLGAVLQRCSTSWIWTHRQLLAVLPRITRNREAVALPLRYFSEDVSIAPPFTDVAYAAFRRDLHALAGDAEEAARWQAIVAAHAPVLADRDRVVALLLWDP